MNMVLYRGEAHLKMLSAGCENPDRSSRHPAIEPAAGIFFVYFSV